MDKGSKIKRPINRSPSNQDESIEVLETPIESSSRGKSENVRVSIRIRPMNEQQLQRDDQPCVMAHTDKVIQTNYKGVQKSYDFNHALGPSVSQSECYKRCEVNELIDAAIEGYSATIFAYGQTGSGKTYTMAGKEDIFSRQVYRRDDREGIIPRAIHQLWNRVGKEKGKYFIKASYTEIYNQQIKDLLNLSSGVLHCRWNPSSGFFVEDLIVVDCNDVDDMISVLHEGMKNRRSGSHQLNKDSSRSHSILTLYIISEMKTSNQSLKKYGKIAFVDLAGSERLKESKSQGEMIKETGNINKSLFTLGKVIKGLTDKKHKTPYIPYRDSKLTMLLMDSLGGNSKALMIACTGPSSLYYDQTLSTLNYAARTMNIRNKPIIQMDQKDQIIQQIQAQIEALKKQNIYLREQYQRVNKGLPIKIPELQKNQMIKTTKLEISQSTQLPPLDKSKIQNSQNISSRKLNRSDTENIISGYQLKFQQVKKQNEVMRTQKDQSEEMYRKLMETNSTLQNKLDNLEQIFLNKKKDNVSRDEIVTSSLLAENTQLKKRLRDREKEKIEMGFQKTFKNMDDLQKIQMENEMIQKEIERLQQRERQLLNQLQKRRS